MRLLAAPSFAVFALAVFVACSGASEQDVLSASSTSSSSSSGSSSGGTASSSGATTSSSGTPSTSSSGGTSDGSTPTKPNPGGPCTLETELNNEPRSANELDTAVCGVLLPPSELDYLTFELPNGTTSMSLSFSGDVKLRVFVEGEDPVELTPTSSPPVPFVVGKQYIVRVSANSGGAPKIDWRVNLDRK